MKRSPPSAGRALSWIRIGSLPHGYGLGTMAAVLRPARIDLLYGLTAGHVLSEDERARTEDGCRLSTHGGGTVDGRLNNWEPYFDRELPVAPIDAGLVELPADALSTMVDDIAWPMGWADAKVGEALRVLTRHHRIGARLRVASQRVPMEVGVRRLRYEISAAAIIDIDDPLQPGDSGAAVWNLRDELVGVIAGTTPPGTPPGAVITPIRGILEWAQAVPVLRHESLVPEDRGQPRQRTPAAPPPAPAALPAGRDAAQEHAIAVDTLARTMWGEARGESQQAAGMTAVAHAVLNRVAGPSWWGSDVVSVCRKHAQFSCWNAGDPNREPMLRATSADPAFALALDIADKLLQRKADDPERVRADPTQGCTHYFARSPPNWPAWAVGQPVHITIGNHLFFKNIR